MSDGDWKLEGTFRDDQTTNADWAFVTQDLIDGVAVKEVRHVPTSYGYLTEIFRTDWGLEQEAVGQVFQAVMQPGALSAWHAHEVTTDRLFACRGQMRVVLYDARPQSPSHGRLNEFRVGTARPTLIVVPPKVWHGVQNAGSTPSLMVNLTDVAYSYEQPDHFRLPPDSDQIPYRF